MDASGVYHRSPIASGLFRSAVGLWGGLLGGVLLVAGCGAGGANDSSTLPDYTGVYRVLYSLASDECGLVDPESTGFEDRHVISQVDDEVTITSDAGFVQNVRGRVSANGRFTAREEFPVSEPGFPPCTAVSAVTYQQPSGTPVSSAETLFVYRLNCVDGFVCESRAIGSAERDPRP